MFALLKALFGVRGLAERIAEAYVARQNAATDQDRIAADERIRTLEARRDVMVAEAGSSLNALIRLAFAVPPAVYLGKLFIFDKVLGLGRTDGLSPELWNVLWTVVGFYFLHWTVAAARGGGQR